VGFYKLEIKKSVFKDLKHIDKHLVKQILLKIEALKENPRGNQSQKLHGTECSHRLRVGDYRIIYQIDDDCNLITVYGIGHRREVYRKFP